MTITLTIPRLGLVQTSVTDLTTRDQVTEEASRSEPRQLHYPMGLDHAGEGRQVAVTIALGQAVKILQALNE